MITFLEFVNVRSHNKEWQFAADGFIPLSPSILKEFERDVKGVYHITDIKGLQKLAKLQGKRVDIATFSKGSKGLGVGLLRTAEVLVTLDGKSSIDFAGDVSSKVDRNGIRWLSSHGSISKKVNDIVFTFGQKILKKVVRNFQIPEGVPGSSMHPSLSAVPRTVPLHIRVGNWIHDKDGKTKRKFIKYYHTEAKKLINKQLIDKISKATEPDYTQFKHDEILLHNFKIVNSKLIRSKDGDKAEKMWKNAEKAGMTKFDVIDQEEIVKL
jgi:hypothetical protein